MQRHFNSGFFWWIERFSLHDLYHSTWFQCLLLLLSINLTVCSLDRLPKTIKLLQFRDERLNPEKLLKFTHHRVIESKLPLEETISRITGLFSNEFSVVRPLDSHDSFSGVAETGRWSRLMVYVVHVSVLMILVGALMGSLWGFKGFMQISEGDSSSEVQLLKSGEILQLPFEVRCDKFEVSFYDTGAPKEFRSDLVIMASGQEALKQSILVNDPLTYDGVTLYQSSYGSTLKSIEVEFKDRESGKAITMTLPFRETVLIPGTEDKVQVVEYQKDFKKFGPAVGIAMLKQGQEPAGSWIMIDRPDFHGNRIQNYQVRVDKAESAYYTGLQVKRDPGVWVVYFGFTSMLLGIGMCFYTSHRKLWLWAEPNSRKRDTTRLIVAGRASKNHIAFEQEFNRLCELTEDALSTRDKNEKKGGEIHGE